MSKAFIFQGDNNSFELLFSCRLPIVHEEVRGPQPLRMHPEQNRGHPQYWYTTLGSLTIHTVCPGSSDSTEKIFDIFASKNKVYTIC